MTTETEQWRSVLGHEGRYEVSDFGRVRSVRRSGRISLIGESGRGKKYKTVNLCKAGSRPFRLVHHLVLEAFGVLQMKTKTK